MDVVGHNAGNNEDDSGNDSDEEEISKAKEKFEDFFKRTKTYWVSFAKERLTKEEEQTVAIEEYALILAEQEFMKETMPDVERGTSDRALNRRSLGRLNGLDHNPVAAGPSRASGNSSSHLASHSAHHRNPVQSNHSGLAAAGPHRAQPLAAAAIAQPLQQQVNQLQQQLHRVDLDEGIE